MEGRGTGRFGVAGMEPVKGLGKESPGMWWGWSMQGHRHEWGRGGGGAGGLEKSPEARKRESSSVGRRVAMGMRLRERPTCSQDTRELEGSSY